MELGTYMRFALALLFVLALIGIVAWLARKAGLGARGARSKGMRRRLSIVEVSAVDGKRRLVLVRRDGVEHLVLLGAANDTVIETGITPPANTSDDTNSPPSISFKSQLVSKMDRKGATGGKAAAKSTASKGAGA